MNILVIPSWYENINNITEGSFFREQAESLAEQGHNVYVLFTDIISIKYVKRILKTPSYEEYRKNKINVYRIKKIKRIKGKGKYLAKEFSKGIDKLYIKHIHNKVKIDVIHAHSSIWGGYAASVLKSKYSIPVMITEHYTGFSRGILSLDELELAKNAFNSANKVVAVSSGLKSDIQKYVDNKEVIVIPNMVDTSLFEYKEYMNKIEDNIKFRFLSICYLNHKKGIDILIKAFSEAFKKNPGVELVIGGDGEERKKLEKLVLELGISDNVKFLGSLNRNEVKIEMQNCNCFVLPSRYETFGVVYIEALALGKPVIATNTDATRDFINTMNGIIVEKENVLNLAEALKEIKKNYSMYDSLKISLNCVNKFGKESVKVRIEKELEGII